MAIWNGLGFVGTFAAAALTALFHYLMAFIFKMPDDDLMIYDLQFGCFCLGIFGLTYDRCEEESLLQGYWLNFTNSTLGSFGKQSEKGVIYRPDRRLCILALPLALAPVFAQIGIILFWIAAQAADGRQNNKALLFGLLAGIPSCVIWYWYSRISKAKRNLPELEIQLQ